MSGPSYVRMYPTDWRSGCLGLSLEQEGLYMRICMFIAETGRRVPLDDSQAARMLGGVNVNQYRKVLGKLLVLGKIKRHEDGYGNDRIEHETSTASTAAKGNVGPDRKADQGQNGQDRPATAEVTGRVTPQATQAVTPQATTQVTHRVTPLDTPLVPTQKTQQNQHPSIEPEPEPRTIEVRETRARGAVEVLAHGVEVNCETIRHSSFSISIPAIELGIAGRLPRDEVKRHCVAHALQWAAEIDGGKASASVVPGKIANFLVASIMGDLNRGAAASRRAEVDKPRRSLTDAIREREAKQRAAVGVTNG